MVDYSKRMEISGKSEDHGFEKTMVTEIVEQPSVAGPVLSNEMGRDDENGRGYCIWRVARN